MKHSTAKRAVEVQGHRGCRGLRPENTMAGFEHAIRLGVDVLELDLGLTRDGVLAVLHDPELDPAVCAGVDSLPTRRVRDLTFAQLQQLDCGARRNPKHPEQKAVPGQRIPRLEQVLDLLARHPRLTANLEIKTFTWAAERRDLTWAPERFADLLASLIVKRKLTGRVVVQSFDPHALRAVRRAGGTITLAGLADRRKDFEPLIKAVDPPICILSPRHTELGRADVAALQAQGLRVIPWTVNEPARMRQLIAWGVDGIITDRPDLLLRLLGRAQ